ncbi:hypothetical protein MAE02_70910 [Microvirga aerophila]|uniref:Uncharacterized protein n=1 Tax=Microvirga aerophila TaxID=670291 RepID=A0A512C5B6_9HYPH|nr:hypothetical protein MAE02_70910 [Microvirga aerophila]
MVGTAGNDQSLKFCEHTLATLFLDGGILAGQRDALALRELHLDLAQLRDNLLRTEPLLPHFELFGSKSILSVNLVQFHPVRLQERHSSSLKWLK